MDYGRLKPSLPSLSEVYAAANWHERETYDLMGIHYDGHPDPTYIDGKNFLPPAAEGLPTSGHRRHSHQTMWPSDRRTVLPAPMMGGPFVSLEP